MNEVSANGVRLAYDVQGEGPPVLLICGTGQPASIYSATLAPVLNQAGWQTVLFDNRGVPPSDVPPPPYSVKEMAQDAIGLMEHLALGPYVVMGSSLGGLIAQRVALERPDLVRAIVFHVGCGNYSAFAKHVVLPACVALFSSEDPPAELHTALYATFFVPPTGVTDEARVQTAVALTKAFVPVDRNGLLGQYCADLAWGEEDHLEELGQLRVPALAIGHEWDLIFPPRLVQEAVSRVADAEYVEIDGAPHGSFDPGHFAAMNRALLDFLERRCRSE